ncbi:uncharacterized protein [Argopecten irradians]|uniref:uncharacterized protein n=1 Tax=Argopecten irradians TaxID=31199 RepID=UPI00371F3579
MISQRYTYSALYPALLYNYYVHHMHGVIRRSGNVLTNCCINQALMAPPLNQTNDRTRQTGGSLSDAAGLESILADLQKRHNLQTDLRKLVRESRRRFNANLVRAINARIQNKSRTKSSPQRNSAASEVAVGPINNRPSPSHDPNGLSPFEVDMDSINPFASSATTISPPSLDQLRPPSPFRSSLRGRQNMMREGVLNNPAGGVPVFLPAA